MCYPRYFLLLSFLASCASAAALDPATDAAFERYAKLTEQQLEAQRGPHDFLWLDKHDKEKSLVWLGQRIVVPLKTLDQGKEIEIPEGSLQHWLGTALLEHATLERVRDLILDYGDYKSFFKQFFTGSRLGKHEGDQFTASLRLSRKQLAKVTLNLDISGTYLSVDANRAYIVTRTTHIGEVDHPKTKDPGETERPSEDRNGYLWRQNVYWRIEQTRDGVFVEMQSITLSRQAGSLNPGRFLNGFVQSYPREFVEGCMEALQQAFPRPH